MIEWMQTGDSVTIKPLTVSKRLDRRVPVSTVAGLERKLTGKEIQVWAPADCETGIETCLLC
jgi:hypothetical protein